MIKRIYNSKISGIFIPWRILLSPPPIFLIVKDLIYNIFC